MYLLGLATSALSVAYFPLQRKKPCPFSGVNLELPKEALFSIPFSAKTFLLLVVRHDLSM